MGKYFFVSISTIVLLLGYEIPYLLGAHQGTLDWNTFRSDKCKMNIDYPTNFTLEENTNKFESTSDFSIYSNNPYIRVLFVCNILDEPSSVNNYSKSISNIQEKLMGHDDFMIEDVNMTKWKVDRLSTFSFIYASGEGAHTGPVTTNEVIYLPHNHGTVIIRFIALYSDFGSPQIQKLEKEMINSIKFL
jgi:hypothetical protein